MGSEFAGYLPHVVPLAIESLEQDDGMASDEEEEGKQPGQQQGAIVVQSEQEE